MALKGSKHFDILFTSQKIFRNFRSACLPLNKGLTVVFGTARLLLYGTIKKLVVIMVRYNKLLDSPTPGLFYSDVSPTPGLFYSDKDKVIYASQ